MTKLSTVEVREVHPTMCFVCTHRQQFLGSVLGLCASHLQAVRDHPLVAREGVPS